VSYRDNFVMNVNAILGNQMIFLVSGRSGLFNDFSRLSGLINKFAFESANIADNSSKAPAVEFRLQAEGTHEFSLKDEFVQVGNTGVMVKVSDLALNESDSNVVADGKKYIVPVFSKAASATVTGTSYGDRITVNQDSSGNTILSVESGGETASLDLGKIASLTVNASAGEDTVNINVKNYFGGITISGGTEDDTIGVNADVSLNRGITVYGDSGIDKLTLSGNVSAVLASGGEGDDVIDARAMTGADLLARKFYGDNGQDLIYGTGGKDELYGGVGSDLLISGGGDDVAYGEAGNDTIYGDEGNDRIYGGTGADTLQGGSGADVINGNEDSDIIIGGGAGDALWGGEGNDYMYGGGNYQISLNSFLGKVEVTELYSFLSGGEGDDTFAPSSMAPWDTAPYSGTGSHLLDYDPAVDILV